MITKRQDISTFQEVRLFIENNFTRDIPVGSLCKGFGINRTKLQEGFNQLFGVSVHMFVSDMRMTLARKLLIETDESVKSIAIDCGYGSSSNFCRIFTSLNKLSPNRYRHLDMPNDLHGARTTGSDN